MRLWGCRTFSTMDRFAPNVIFSKENRVKTATKFSRMKAPYRSHPNDKPAKKAAVLIPLCTVNDKVSLLYTLRAPHLRSHRGQVSFPGGRVDETDPHLEHTALRETHEELGISEDDIEIWGSGKLIVTRGETSVLPVIGHIIIPNLKLDQLQINPREVKEVFTVTLEDLCNPENLRHTQFKGTYSAPVFLGGSKRIWGLTAFITYFFLKALLPSSAYNHRIEYLPSVLANSYKNNVYRGS